MNTRRLAIALSLLALAACAEVSTPTGIAAGEAAASQDGGLVVGSGNRSGQDSTSNQSPTAAGDGGLVVGSGN